MNNEPQSFYDTISHRISGFHQYCFAAPARPVFISRNLCQMLGMTEEALMSEEQDLYAQRIHPADLDYYLIFLKDLAEKAQTLNLHYRLIRTDGSVVFVNDTMTSYLQDSCMMGDSVLTDIERKP